MPVYEIRDVLSHACWEQKKTRIEGDVLAAPQHRIPGQRRAGREPNYLFYYYFR